MSSCCPADVKAVTTIVGSVVTSTYLDMREVPPKIMDEADYLALQKVKCPESVAETDETCLQEIGNTDASKIVSGLRCVIKTISYKDTAGVVNQALIDQINLVLLDGTDVTSTHEEVACPQPIVVEADACVAPA